MSKDTIYRQDAIDSLCKVGCGSGYCGVSCDDVKAIEQLPSAQPTLHGYNIEHLELIARILQKEDLPPERVVEALTDIGRIVTIVRDEFEETLRRAVDQISRQAAIDALEKVADLFPWRVPGKGDTYDRYNEAWNDAIGRTEMEIEKLPSVQPTYTDEQIQKMQDMEQAEIEKAFELGGADAKAEIVRCKDCRHSEHWYGDKSRCFLWHEEGIDVFEDGFCNYAERRTE